MFFRLHAYPTVASSTYMTRMTASLLTLITMILSDHFAQFLSYQNVEYYLEQSSRYLDQENSLVRLRFLFLLGMYTKMILISQIVLYVYHCKLFFMESSIFY